MAIITALVVALILAAGFGIAGKELYWKFRYVTAGRNDKRADFDNLGERATGFAKYVLGQARTLRELGGMFHFFIFWGFIVVQTETLELFVRAFWPAFRWKMIMGETLYHGMIYVQDTFTVLVFAAVIAAIIRRFVIKPDHTTRSADAAIILGLEVLLIVSRYLMHMFEFASMTPEQIGWDPAYTPVSTALTGLLGGVNAHPEGSALNGLYHMIGVFWMIVHIGTVAFFAYWISTGGKHIHLIGATSNVFFRKLDPKGMVYPMPQVVAQFAEDAEEDADFEYFGVQKMEDLSWKQLLDTYACTECARCEHYCPAFNTGKELNPMMIIQKLKAHVKDKGQKVIREGGEMDEEAATLAGGVISVEELFACTTCGACVANCPVFIEHVDTIIDLRRYLVLNEVHLPTELSRTFRNIDNASNPWGISSSKRADWADGLDIPIMGELDLETERPEYLFFVGCAGSFDDRQKKVTKAMAEILKAAGVTYAILGPEEGCTGDAARRAGNEYTYWAAASANVEVFNTYGVTKVITTCPHCFHTIGKEYPQLGGNYEVVHHTKLLNDLLAAGKLKLKSNGTKKYTYHDSCYIGRWNEDYSNPREALKQVPGIEIAEMEWNERKALCCGAGGAQMWMEEHQGKRVNQHRADMALRTEAEGLIVNCPFCMTMLSDGLKAREASYQPLDLAEVVAQALITEGGSSLAEDAAE